MDLEVAGADRHLEPVAVATRLLERLRDLRLAGPEEAQACAAAAACPRSSTRRTASVSSAFGQSRCSSRGRPGQDDDRRPVRVDHEAGRGAGEPEDAAPSGTVACLRTPCAKSAYGRFSRSATRARQPSICASSSSSTSSSSPRDLGDDLDRAIVVGRAEAARAGDEVGRGERVAQRRLELGGVVADDLDPRRLDPEGEERASEEGAVQIGALAPHELAAGDDDHRPWARSRPGSTRVGGEDLLRRHEDALRLDRARRASPCCRSASRARSRGVSRRTQSTLPSKRCRWPRSSVPW